MSIVKETVYYAGCDECELSLSQGTDDRFKLIGILKDIGWKIIKDKRGYVKKILCHDCQAKKKK